MHDELSIGMADVWLASDFGGAAMSECPEPSPHDTVARQPERIRAIEAELADVLESEPEAKARCLQLMQYVV